MKICMVHNEYGSFGGEEAMLEGICRLLMERGHEVLRFTRSSAEIPKMRLGKVRAFFSGIHSSSAAREFANLIAREKPDIVQIQNVYPFISPVVFKISKQAAVPVVFRCANYRLFCPNGLLHSHGEVCDRCVWGKEYWCVLRNCTGSIPKSIGYALRNACARASGAITKNTTMYYVPSEFQKRKFITWGISGERIAVIPNFINVTERFGRADKLGDYVGYAGRISPEKGLPSLLGAAWKCRDIPFRIAGGLELMPELASSAPPNVKFLGRLTPDDMPKFYANARMLVTPSIWYETFGMVIIEAMIQRRPIIASKIGPITVVVDDNVTGLLFEPSNAKDLAKKIRYLWDRPELCRKMGRAGREKALREYSPEKYYERLMTLFRLAVDMNMSLPDNQITV
jgi:glycosyltransferase involved in cell wall biosynthesis